MLENDNAKQEHKLLIEFIFRKNKTLSYKQKFITQNKPYKFGFKIKNIGNKVSPEIKIKNLTMEPCDSSSNIWQKFNDEVYIKKLNPQQETTLIWPEILTSFLKDQIWIRFDIVPENDKIIIKTFLFDKNNKRTDPVRGQNFWKDAIIIRGELEQQQSITNLLILILTSLVFIDAVFGVKTVLGYIFKFLSWIILQIGFMLIKIG